MSKCGIQVNNSQKNTNELSFKRKHCGIKWEKNNTFTKDMLVISYSFPENINYKQN